MTKLFSLLIAMLFSGLVLSAQDRGPLSLSIICNGDITKKNNEVVFILECINIGKESVSIPDRIVSSPNNTASTNMGFEILRVYKQDTINVLDTHNQDTNARIFGDNKYILLPGSMRLIKTSISSFYFEEDGVYMVRFILRKKGFFSKGNSVTTDVISNWAVLN